ncbi:MAG: alpha/beta fold hydrolase [Deltaproteobacteria bacterium]|nr:alpha/beta fold hydrolase [Deltaproteobacteria bacterium]
MPVARLSRATLHYEVTGEGPPLLCVMGFGAPLEGFALQARVLAKHRTVVSFDNRGAGRSSVPPLPWAIPDLAQDALDLMDHLALPRADLLGVSMGGMICQRIAISRPERVGAMVLAATFSHADQALRRRVAKLTAMSVTGWARSGFGGRAAFEKALRAAWESHVVADEPLDAEGQAILDRGWDLRTELGSSDLGAVGQLWALLTHDAREELRRIVAPTLVLAGSADALSPLDQGRMLAKLIPGARLEILAGATHGMNLASAPLFNAAVESFLLRSSPLPRPEPVAKGTDKAS